MAADRRTVLGLAALGTFVPALPTLAQAPSAGSPADGAGPGADLTGALAAWATGVRYEDLPPEVVHAAKRDILDSIGCAYAGWRSPKGRLAAEAMVRLGGAGDATVWGARGKIAATHAAFANAELMNALDYDAIPHVPPATLPAVAAVAQQRAASGKDFILAVVVSHEIAARLSAASSQMQSALAATGQTPDVFGINNEGIMAAAAALGGLLKLDPIRTRHAIGLAGYYCPPQVSRDWESLHTKTNVKYTPMGLINQSAVTAALLAEQGFTSTPDVFAPPTGFSRFYGWPAWKPGVAGQGLGEQWRILGIDFKPYAACRFIHSQIDCMRALHDRHRFAPGDIVGIETLGVPFVAHPDPMNVTTAEDAQFSTPYNLALAACGIAIDADAQSPQRLADPVVRAVMRRIRWGVHPGSPAAKAKDPRSYIARVSVTLKDGRILVEDALYPLGTASQPDKRLSDEFLLTKFRENTEDRLGRTRASDLAARLQALEGQGSVQDLFGDDPRA